MFQFFRFLPKSDYVSLWCLLPVVDEDCENVKTMSGFQTCPHFPLNPIIVNFNLCYFSFYLFYVWRTNISPLSLNPIILNFDLCFFIFSMSGVGTCPHFLLNPIIVNFDLCFCHYHCNLLATIIIFTITTLSITPAICLPSL